MADTSTYNWKLLYEAGRQALQARELQKAEQSFSAALQLAEDFAAGDARLAATLNALARIYSLQRRYLAAAALLNRLLEVTERTLGPGHVQVAGVLTNLAEMYTHLGAAREELELRERVLGIRTDDPNADPTALQRLRERVVELRSTIAAQDPPAPSDADEFELLPSSRAPEQRERPTSVVELDAVAPAEQAVEIVSVVEPEPALPSAPAVAQPIATESSSPTAISPTAISPVSISPVSVAPWPGVAVTDSTPSGGRTTVELDRPRLGVFAELQPTAIVEYVGAPEPARSLVLAGDHAMGGLTHGDSRLAHALRTGNRSSIYSIAAGVVLVAGLLAARGYVNGSDDERVSTGSVNLANSAAAALAPIGQSTPTLEPRTVEHLMAERRADRESKRTADMNSEYARVEPSRGGAPDRGETAAERAPRIPSAAEIERALRGLDGAVQAINQRTRAATDSATAIRVQAPTFKKVRLADP